MANQLSSLFVTVGAKTDGFHKAMGGVQGKLQDVSQKMRNVGIGMAGSAAAIGGAGIKMAADFDGAMREVNTMLLLNEDEFKALSDDTQELARRMGVDATDAANALYQAISAGVPKDNAIEFMEVASKAAIGGVTDTETAVDGLTTVMNAFKMPVEDAQNVADLMFTTVKNGKTTFEELSASMSQAAPMAAAIGVPFEDLMAATATLTKQGVPTAQAMTQIRQSMVSLTKPTGEMQDLLAEMGYESGEALLEAEGYAGAMEAVREATAGNTDMLGKALGSVESLNAMYALTGQNADAAAEDMNAMTDATGAATDAFEQMEQSTSRQWQKMVAQLKDVAISIGKGLVPALTKLLEAVAPILTSFANWVSENPELTAAILVIVGAIGTLLVVIGPLVSAIGAIVAAAPVMGAALAALTGPVGIVIAIIIGIVAAVVAVIKHWDWIKETAGKVWNAISGFVSDHADTIKDVLLAMTPVGPIIQHWDEIKAGATKIWNGLVDFFRGIPGKIKNAFSTLTDIMLAPFRFAIEGYQRAINWLIKQVNKLSISIPSWVPGIGGKTMGFNIPTITLPSFGTGGIVTSPTIAMVGERGPEAIVPLDQMGETFNFNIAELVVREESDIKRIARELERLRESKGRARGLSFAV